MERYDLNAVPNASSETAGVLRVANEIDEKNCGCKDAAITPSNLYSLLDCRKANTAYTAGAIVSCPYHKEFLLKCTTGGTTSANTLDTTSVTKGGVITDGSAKWTVIASQIIDLSISGKVITVTFIDGTQKTLTTQDTGSDMTDYIVESYRNGLNWYKKYKSGWVEQGGYYSGTISVGGSSSAISLSIPFADVNYHVFPTNTRAGNVGAPLTVAEDSKTTTSFKLWQYNTGQNAQTGARWYACGQGA